MSNAIEATDSCYSKDLIENKIKKEDWIIDYKDTVIGKIPVITSNLTCKDIINGWLVRWAVGRNNYKIEPGLYCIGSPSEKSPVMVTANYKLTFDKLRKELSQVDAWILVLDTKGINVWCAAGKGTFGTEELLNRITITKLEELVSHKTLILPQLGAVGVSAHEIKKNSGFKVIYGPVRAKDIFYFLNNNYKKTKEMRSVRFDFIDRFSVIPVEFIQALKYMLIALGIVAILSIVENKSVNIKIIINFIPYLGAFIIGTILIPVFLPFIPFRSFSLKGLLIGLIWAAIVQIIFKPVIVTAISNFLILPSLTTFLAMNFTGATTFTSLTGARLEVKYTFIPAIIALITGLILKITSVFLNM